MPAYIFTITTTTISSVLSAPVRIIPKRWLYAVIPETPVRWRTYARLENAIRNLRHDFPVVSTYNRV
jgi:hypothetical protein